MGYTVRSFVKNLKKLQGKEKKKKWEKPNALCMVVFSKSKIYLDLVEGFHSFVD